MNLHAMSVGLAVAGIMIAATSGTAAVNPIGPFSGDYSENFEDIAPPGGLPGPADIFMEQATVDDTLAHTLVLATVTSAAETDWENFFPYDGFLMGLVPTGWCAFEFDTPVLEFGGYFGTASIMSDGFISFYDEDGGLLETQDFDIPALAWDWYGWSSDVPIGRIEIHGHSTPGKPLVFDNMELTQVPAPGVMAVLSIGLGVPAMRRRMRA
jgi:hypothetical protein